MRKVLLLIAIATLALVAHAVPAVPGAVETIQPDGSKLMVRIIGDEFFNYYTTTDGYTIVKNNDGYFVYAQRLNDVMQPTAIIAHDADKRSASEVTFLNSIEKFEFSRDHASKAKLRRAPVDAATKSAALKAANYDYNNFRGLIVLVQYTDLKFSRSDAKDFYTKMATQKGYTGYTNEDGSSNRYGAFTGSVRDYFYDNSQQRFDPQFDVVGPVTVSYSANDHNQTSGTGAIWAAALRALDSEVDFSKYDTDGDGNVDMVYFIGAGSGSNSDSQNSSHLWPHKSDLYYQNLRLDGVRFRTYACSTEYLYNSSYGILDGIGTICHEFSHVLGLPDLYDTDYATNGQSQHPGEWEVMAGGSYQNNARTPVAYSLYDRYSIGFANPKFINAKGEYSLNQIGSTGDGYILNSPEAKVKFYIENRQNTRWDAYAPGHGMLICRVDSTSASAWTGNSVNDYSDHNYYVLLRAGNGSSNAQASDAFPAGAMFINNNTTPNLKTYNGSPCQYNLTNIRENNGVITFTVGDDSSLQSVVEDFEMMPVTSSTSEESVQGVYSTWRFVNCAVQAPGEEYCNGEHATAMKRPSSLTMNQDVRYVTYMISFDVNNSSSTAARFILYSSADRGETWEQIANAQGDVSTTVAANSSTTVTFPVDINEPVRYRISMSAGATTLRTYIDDFTIYYTDVIPEEAITLASLLENGEENEEYLIADELNVVECAEGPKYAFLTDGNNNWIRVDAGNYYESLAAMKAVDGASLRGVFTGKDFIPTLALTGVPTAVTPATTVAIKEHSMQETFAPKVNEVIYVSGYYNEQDNALRAFSGNPQGQSASLDLSWMTGATWQPVDGKRYRVMGVAQIKEPWKNVAAPSLLDYDFAFQNYLIFPLAVPVATAIESLTQDAKASIVNVYNMQGQLVKAQVDASRATQGLQPGIYLIAGKKVVVK